MPKMMTEFKSRYIRAKDAALNSVHSQFLIELLDMRKTCNHQPGINHLTGVGTKITLCKNCGDVISEHIV